MIIINPIRSIGKIYATVINIEIIIFNPAGIAVNQDSSSRAIGHTVHCTYILKHLAGMSNYNAI